MKNDLKWLYRGAGLIGVLFSGIGVATWHSTQQFLGRSRSVVGEVIELRQGRDSGSPSRSVAVVQFHWEGEARTLVTQTETQPPAYSVGQQVDVRVDPARPEDVRLDSWLELYFLSAVFGFLGGVFLLISFLIRRLGGTDPSDPAQVA